MDRAIYSWGYGCSTAPTGFAPTMPHQTCNTMQVPGPTLIVTEGQTVTVTLTNGLPTSAGNTSILFPGFNVTATGGVAGLLTKEAAPGGSVTYTFTAGSPGTRSYYSGTQGDLQVEMGLYGAIIVLPSSVPTACTTPAIRTTCTEFANYASANGIGTERTSVWRRLPTTMRRPATTGNTSSSSPRWTPGFTARLRPRSRLRAGCTAGAAGCSLEVPTEPYHPAYFMINGRSMPDDMDPNYAAEYPHQPYNGNPHLHPGEQVLLRIIGQGRWQHPFHEHANHVRILARDGNLILSATDATQLAGPALFTTTTTPGHAMDGIFYYTGRGLNWDMYGTTLARLRTQTQPLPCTPDANGYNTSTAARTQINYFEWCQDHNKPLQAAPFGDVAGGGPVTLPDPNILTNGAWYGGSPYLGPDATLRATGCMASGTAQTNSQKLRRHGYHSSLGHDRQQPQRRGRLRVHVALPQ